MRIVLLMVVFLMGFVPCALAQTDGGAMVMQQDRPATFSGLAKALLPTVVNVSSTLQGLVDNDAPPEVPVAPPIAEGSPFENFYNHYKDNGDGQAPLSESASLGSGFIIDAAKGLIITNNHVIRDSSDIRITLHDDSTYRAKVLGADEKIDIALLQIDPKGAALQQVTFGDSETLEVGDWILAIGNPFGLGGTVTAGIVSARGRDINAGPYDDFIQTDASINRGNSGGPMFNTKGELIGINTAIFSPSGGSVGIGFAIPVNMVKPVIRQLTAYGKTKRGWMGVKVQSVTPEISESLGLQGGPQGALIAAVTPDGPGAKAGMRPYDILLSFGGKKVPTMRDLPRLVAEAEVGESIPIELYRDGRIIAATTVLGELEMAEDKGLIDDTVPAAATPEPSVAVPIKPLKTVPATPKTTDALFYRGLGLTIAPITPALARKYDLVDGMTGLVITRVADFSDGARKGILPGDVILEVNQERINAISEFDKSLAASRAKARQSLMLLLDRSGDERFVAIKLEKLVPLKKSSTPKEP